MVSGSRSAPGRRSSSSRIRYSSPTSTMDAPSSRQARMAPSMVADGALSPPMASMAIGGGGIGGGGGGGVGGGGRGGGPGGGGGGGQASARRRRQPSSTTGSTCRLA